jgi:hypothetical protein
MNGTATAIGLNDMAAPHNPAPATITLMLNRSKIVINVNSFIRAHIFRNHVVQQNRVVLPKSWLDDRLDC